MAQLERPLTIELEQGKCPYKTCNKQFFLGLSDEVNGYSFIPHNCVECKRLIWTRVGGGSVCESFPQDTFEKHFNIDKKSRRITPKVVKTESDMYKVADVKGAGDG